MNASNEHSFLDIPTREGKPRGRVIRVERVLEVLRPAPPEQDDRDVEQERHAERAVRIADGSNSERLRDYEAAEGHEQQDRGYCGTSRNDVAARQANGLLAHGRSTLSTRLSGAW